MQRVLLLRRGRRRIDIQSDNRTTHSIFTRKNTVKTRVNVLNGEKAVISRLRFRCKRRIVPVQHLCLAVRTFFFKCCPKKCRYSFCTFATDLLVCIPIAPLCLCFRRVSSSDVCLCLHHVSLSTLSNLLPLLFLHTRWAFRYLFFNRSVLSLFEGPEYQQDKQRRNIGLYKYAYQKGHPTMGPKEIKGKRHNNSQHRQYKTGSPIQHAFTPNEALPMNHYHYLTCHDVGQKIALRNSSK